MNKLLLFAVCIAFVLTSCVKKGIVPPKVSVLTDSISATIDGVNENFNSNDTVRNIGTTGVYVSGTNGTSTTADRIIGIVTSPKGLGVGSYTFPSGDNSAVVQLMFQPAGNSTDGYYYTYYTEPSLNDPGLNYPGTITITSVDSTKIVGTFSGSLISVASVTNTANIQSKTITDGKFKIYLKK